MGKAVAEAIVAHLDEGIQIPAVVLEWHLVERRSTAVMSVMGEAVRVGRGSGPGGSGMRYARCK